MKCLTKTTDSYDTEETEVSHVSVCGVSMIFNGKEQDLVLNMTFYSCVFLKVHCVIFGDLMPIIYCVSITSE